MSVAYGIHTLYISTSSDRQFAGIRKVLGELSRESGSALLLWAGGATDLRRRRLLRRVLISGHGNAEQAGFELSTRLALRPEDLPLPRAATLYLAGCHQGAPRLLHRWAAGTGLSPQRIRGCSGETESALSTCLLLHILEEGAESLERWFESWVRCNHAFRPHFALIRRLYARNDADPLAVLGQLRNMEPLQPLMREHESYLSVIERRPACLGGLL